MSDAGHATDNHAAKTAVPDGRASSHRVAKIIAWLGWRNSHPELSGFVCVLLVMTLTILVLWWAT